MLVKDEKPKRLKRTDVPEHLVNLPAKRQYIRVKDVLKDTCCPQCHVEYVTRRTIQDSSANGTLQYRYCPACGLAGPKTWTSVLK